MSYSRQNRCCFSRPFAESLEPRRLLAASIDALGIVTITGGDEDNIIQFQVADSAGGGPAVTFDVLESTATGAAPPLSFPTQQEILDYIDSGGSSPAVTTFNLADVREIQISSGGGDDLIILGQKLPISASIDAGSGNDSVSAGTRDDTITGGSGNDYVFGHGGNDAIGGALGGDEILGGAGVDAGDYKTRDVDLNISINNLAGDGQSGENDNVRTDIEKIIGGSAADTINASGAAAGVVLDGADGDDDLTGSPFDDVLVGGAGNDSASGGAGDDRIFVEDGEDDDFDGGDGDDVAFADLDDSDQDVEFVLFGSTSGGDPTLVPGGSATINNRVLTVTGGGASDLIGVSLSQDGQSALVLELPDYPNATDEPFVSEFPIADFDSVLVNLGSGADLFQGTDLDDQITINGNDGNDVIAGGAASDVINGGNGDDWLFGRGGDDSVSGGAGGDFQSGGAGNDTATYAGGQQDVLVGVGQIPDDGARGEGDNVQLDIETVIGGNGNDRLNTQGSTGMRFIGGPGRDIITGGSGSDEYALLDGEIDTVRGGGGGDNVLDQDNNDDIDLNG